MRTDPATHKYLFAHYVRAVGVSMVLLTHLGTAFFNMNPFMASLVNVPALPDASYPALVQALLVPPSLPGFLAVCGVALFFLVSGFVIPFSIEKYRLHVFFTKRFFRLYPTYLLVFFLNAAIAVLGYYCFRHVGVEYPYSLRTVMAAAAMGLSNFMRMISLDPVSWTLAVELVFYLLAAVFFRLWFRLAGQQQITALPVLVLGAGVSVMSVLISLHPAWLPAIFQTDFIAKSLHLVAFMLMGTSFYLHIKGRLRDGQLFLMLLLQFAGFIKTHMLFAVPTEVIPLTIPTDQLFNQYGIALLLFAVFYLLRAQFTFARIPSFLADVSYPLYLCHSYIAYFVMGALLYATPLPKSVVIFVPIPLALGAAYLIHRYCERRFASATIARDRE